MQLIIAPVSNKARSKFCRGLSREKTSPDLSLFLSLETEKKRMREICLLRTFFRRRLKDSRVASCRPCRVVFMRRKFPGEIKTSRLGATRRTAATATATASV